MVRIVDIREDVASMRSNIRNAFIDFSKMTSSSECVSDCVWTERERERASQQLRLPSAQLHCLMPNRAGAVVAVVTDVERDGLPVVGFGFNSNGRYAASGILRERFIPRLLEADDAAVRNDDDTNLDPHKCWDIMMAGEKPGGHGERSVACGVLDMALWDAVAKIEDKPLCAVLAERYGCKAEGLTGYVGPSVPMERVWVYAAGGYYQPEKDHTKLQQEMQGYLDMGFKTVKMKIGGAPLEEDIERSKAVLEVTGGGGDSLAVDANGRFDLETAKACEDAASLSAQIGFEYFFKATARH